ncbi:MAG: hypothetical protein V3T23_07165, partial [Nitrososphaerales archaeon]
VCYWECGVPVVCSLIDIPFYGTWNEQTGEIDVKCYWSDEDLQFHVDWHFSNDAAVLSSSEELREAVEIKLTYYLKDNTCNWIYSRPNSDT